MPYWWYMYFFQKTGFDISYKLIPVETSCLKCQILFSRKKKKDISLCILLKILPSLLSIHNVFFAEAIVPDVSKESESLSTFLRETKDG